MSTAIRPILLAAMLGTALLLSACSTPVATERTIQPGEIVGVWQLDTDFPDAPEQPFVSFVQDNTWTASDGCNQVQGTWDLASDGTLTTTAGPSTMMACDGAQLPLAVSKADSVSVDGDTLTIKSSFDSTTTILVRSTDPLVGPQGFPIGYWVEENTPTSPFLSISADRTFTGNDGCNNIFGEWETGDNEVTLFTHIGSTQMYCEDVDAWLSTVAQATVRAGVMTLQSEDGTVIGQLTGR